MQQHGIDIDAIKARDTAMRKAARLAHPFVEAARSIVPTLEEISERAVMLSGVASKASNRAAGVAERGAKRFANHVVAYASHGFTDFVAEFSRDVLADHLRAAALLSMEQAWDRAWQATANASGAARSAAGRDVNDDEDSNYSAYVAATCYPAVVAAIERAAMHLQAAHTIELQQHGYAHMSDAFSRDSAEIAAALRAARKVAKLAQAYAAAERAYRELASGREPISQKERVQIIALFQRTCAYCAGSSESDAIGPDGRSWHIDHVFPVVRGGTNVAENLVLSCATCNLRKNARLGYMPARPTLDLKSASIPAHGR